MRGPLTDGPIRGGILLSNGRPRILRGPADMEALLGTNEQAPWKKTLEFSAPSPSSIDFH